VKFAASLHWPVSTPNDAVQENGTTGEEGKAVGCVPPTALLFEQRSSGLCILMSIKDSNWACGLELGAALSQKAQLCSFRAGQT
jgi:hypothetical protein